MALGMSSYIVQWAQDDLNGDEAIMKKEGIQGAGVAEMVKDILDLGAHWVEVTVEA